MTSPRYYDLTHFLTDPNEICKVYVKLKIRHFVLENFMIFGIFIKKITVFNKVYFPCRDPCDSRSAMIALRQSHGLQQGK